MHYMNDDRNNKNNKMKHKLLTIAAALLCLVACSNEDAATPEPQTGLPIKLYVSVGNPYTRAGYSSTDMPSTFYLKVTQEDRDYSYFEVFVEHENDGWGTYEDESKENKTTMLWQSTSANATVSAYTQNWFTGLPNDLPTDQSTADKLKEADVLYMPLTNVPYNADGIGISLKHLMSKLVFTITLGDEYAYSADELATKITDVAVQGLQTGAECSLDKNSEQGVSITTLGAPKDIKPCCTASSPYSEEGETVDKAKVTYEALIIPQTFGNGELIVSFKVDGKDYRWVSGARTLKVNTQYNLELTAGNDQVRSTAMRTAAWGHDGKTGDIKTANRNH